MKLFFRFPEDGMIESFINNNYLLNKEFSMEEIQAYLRRIIYYIGSRLIEYDIEWQVFLNYLINH